MAWSDYWGALGSRQRKSLLAGIAVVVAAAVAAGAWLLLDPYVALASHLAPDRAAELGRQLDRAKLPWRLGDEADAVFVPQSQLGAARAALSSGDALPPEVGLELFKETDFSATDFTQRINYQRALQGELARTIQSFPGVRSVRVHVVLPDGGLFRRASAKASAAVSLAMRAGVSMTPAQVQGIQRLVAASVPEIRAEDIVVLDESGTGVVRSGGADEGLPSSAQLDFKRQVDQYLEGKLQRLLQDLVPQGSASVSVDALLDERQLRVTTEEPLAAAGPRDADHLAGVLVKERQSQRQRASLPSQGASDAEADVTDLENEYKVGHRLEQVLSAPGSIRRISVAVAMQGAPAGLAGADIERLVANAVGVDRARGDSVAVLLLPAAGRGLPPAPAATPPVAARDAGGRRDPDPVPRPPLAWTAEDTRGAVLLAAAFGLGTALVALVRRRRRVEAAAALAPPLPDELALEDAAEAGVDVDATAAQVRQWLSEGAGHGRA
jgi:flagellar M-ring protein FliF